MAEVFGLIAGVIPSIIFVVEKYQQLLRITTGSADVDDIRTKVLLERAKFETSLQRLSRFQALPPDMAPIINEMGQNMDSMMASLIKYTRQQEKMSTKILGRLQWNQQEMDGHLKRLSALNESLEATCTRLISHERVQDYGSGVEIHQDISEDQKKVREPLFMLAPDYDVRNAERGYRLLDKKAQQASDLHELATSCSSLLRLRGTEDPLFSELSNQFELWRHGLESERFYQAVKLHSRQSLRHDMVLLLYQAMFHIGETIALSWDLDDHSPDQSLRVRQALDEFASTSIRVREAVQDLDLPPPTVDASGSKDDQKANAIQTLELVIGTLRDFLPSIVSFSRTCMALEKDTPAAVEVKELLEASIKMVGPGSEALSRAAEVTKAQPDESTLVDAKLITEVFHRQAAYLEKWAEKHKQDIGTKLANESPAKFAYVADAVKKIAYYLDKLPTAVDDQLSKSSASPKGSLDNANPETVASIIKGLETHVQLLLGLESQLESLGSLPPYSKMPGDRVVIDIMSGETGLAR